MIWQAPRTAYLMTAMTAEGDTEGPPGLWYRLDGREQLDVLRALGAQCRAAVRGARDAGYDLDLFAGPAGDLLREKEPHAVSAFEAILAGQDPEMPGCPSCRLATAALLCCLAVDSGRKTGLSRELIAHHCRQAAEQVAAL